ncbi:hypothetical protein [Marinobacter aromaticivorans]|uniref:Minor tail protein n=1 Tax=Marinobacter aromaticivorans TaxID=1494078 RepID=A0ABW2IZD7_9GAMM|nr:hypothetical protein [Marinobacter aromaticivorans]
MYEPSPLEAPVALPGNYTPPDIQEPVVLCQPATEGPVALDPVILALGYTPPPLTEPVFLCVDVSRLSASLPPPAPALLSFSAAGSQAYRAHIDAAIAAPTLPVLSLQATALMASSLASVVAPPQAPGLTLQSSLKQNLDLPDNSAKRVSERYKTSSPKTVTPLQLLNNDGNQISVPLAHPHQHGISLGKSLTAPASEMIRYQASARQSHQHGIPLTARTDAQHAEAIRYRASARTRHTHGIKRHGSAGIPHAEYMRQRDSLRMAEQQAVPATKGLSVGSKNAWPTGTRLEIRWQHAAKPAPGYWWPDWADEYTPPGFVIAIPCAGYQPRPLRCEVVLGTGYPPQPPCPTEPGQDTIIIPVREAYHVINELTLTELNGTPVAAEDFSASIDADSWTWSWSTRIPASALSQVRPDSSTRVELIATINGEPLRVLVENIQRERRFGESWLRVSGRGRAAFLAEPLAPVIQYTNDTPLTAQQALNAAMTVNGIPIGWTLDWQIEDWQIPAGIWSHSGTWIDAAKRIAEAGGAYVQSHYTDQVLRILPRYPTAPWNWSSAVPDIALPEDVVEVEGIEWQEKPDYNAVYVHGGDQGRADRIIVGTSGGTNPAPTIVDELATDPAMTRQRGLALLGDTGKQASISLRLPVLPETGMIRPGTLVEYLEQGNTRRGLVRSLSISHSRPELWQTIGVETHE